MLAVAVDLGLGALVLLVLLFNVLYKDSKPLM